MDPEARSDISLSLKNNRDFLVLTQKQIKKDFSAFSQDFPDNFEETAYTVKQIHQIIVDHVYRMLEGPETVFLQFLYGIDLSESEFLGQVQREDFAEEIARRILYREAYKVYLRKKYSA